MVEVRIALTIASETPLSVGAGGSVGTLADKSIVRDGWGRPTIPGSQVKGKLRWAAEQILRGLGQEIPTPFDTPPERVERETLVRALFGSPGQRSPLYFIDLPGVIGDTAQMGALRSSPEQHQSLIRPSVTINRQRGTAEDQRLLFQEVAPEVLRFHADPAIHGRLEDRRQIALLWAALRLTTRWGGAKSRGLGWASVDAQIWADRDELDEDALRQDLCDLLPKRGGR